MKKNDLHVEKICISLPPESLTQLAFIAEIEKLPPRCPRSMLIRIAIQRAYDQALINANNENGGTKK